jgi:hypothetical protein
MPRLALFVIPSGVEEWSERGNDIDGCAARVAARESGAERVNLWISTSPLHEIRDLSTSLEMTGSQKSDGEFHLRAMRNTVFRDGDTAFTLSDLRG